VPNLLQERALTLAAIEREREMEYEAKLCAERDKDRLKDEAAAQQVSGKLGTVPVVN
jgi:hypothetical protein